MSRTEFDEKTRMNHNFIDLTGERFGRLVAIDFETRLGKLGGRARVFWRCKCDCGSEHFVCAEVLRRGEVRSCKCFQKEDLSRRSKTHGARRTALYRIWTHILSRCRNQNVDQYPNYGGRGIKVCKEWEISFESFAAYVGERPTPRHSIDRYPDNDGDYEPGNVRWATSKEQGRNRRVSVMVEFGGNLVCLAEAVEQAGIPYSTVYCRIFKHGWPVSKALETPSRRRAA